MDILNILILLFYKNDIFCKCKYKCPNYIKISIYCKKKVTILGKTFNNILQVLL